MPTRWLHFRIDEQLHERASRAAAADRRNLSNWVALTIERALDDAASTPTGQPAPSHPDGVTDP